MDDFGIMVNFSIMGDFEIWVTFEFWVTFELWLTFPIQGGDKRTNKQTDAHTHQYHDSAWPRGQAE